MGIHRLNHAVLYVRDARRSAEFYRSTLGFRPVFELGDGQAVFMQAAGSTNDHDLALMQIGSQAVDSGAGRSSVGLYHLAWEVDTLDDLRRTADLLLEAGALVGSSSHGTTKSLYAKDPDGLEFEVCWIIPRELIGDRDLAERGERPRPLDLAAEIERFGADLPGGVGVSR